MNYKMFKYFIAQIKKYLNIKIFLFVNIENFTQTYTFINLIFISEYCVQ